MLRTRLFQLILTVLTTLVILHLLFQHQPQSSPHHLRVNTTLNFGTILAVSLHTSPRLPSLLWAANLTNLSISIPPQPAWTPTDLYNFRLKNNSVISEGSARAWLGHIHVLRQFLRSGKETALIIEDDADWDLRLKTQMHLLASHLHILLTPSSPAAPASPTQETQDFWPAPATWDILYPGHCDDALASPSNPLLSHPHAIYTDPSVPPPTLLHPDTLNFLSTLRVPSETRFLHRSFAPLCTVAYAVHRSSATRILEAFSREGEGVGAFDVQLLRACGEGWKCYSVSPEVFHHRDGGSEIAAVDRGVSGDGVTGEGGMRKGTWNLRCGARDGQLWVGEGDGEGREEALGIVREMMERGKGECLIDFGEAERSWRGCEWGECGAQS